MHTELYVFLQEAPDYIWHTPNQTNVQLLVYTTVFVSRGVGMCERLNSFTCNLPFYALCMKKRTASIQKSLSALYNPKK